MRELLHGIGEIHENWHVGKDRVAPVSNRRQEQSSSRAVEQSRHVFGSEVISASRGDMLLSRQIGNFSEPVIRALTNVLYSCFGLRCNEQRSQSRSSSHVERCEEPMWLLPIPPISAPAVEAVGVIDETISLFRRLEGNYLQDHWVRYWQHRMLQFEVCSNQRRQQ